MHMQTIPPHGDMRGGNLSIGIDRALDHIENRFVEKLYLEELAALAGLSVCRFVRVFHRQVGISPHRYICHLRVRHAKHSLRAGTPLAVAAAEAGFFDQSHLSRHFKTVCGLTPGQYISQFRTPDPPLRSAASAYAPAWFSAGGKRRRSGARTLVTGGN